MVTFKALNIQVPNFKRYWYYQLVLVPEWYVHVQAASLLVRMDGFVCQAICFFRASAALAASERISVQANLGADNKTKQIGGIC